MPSSATRTFYIPLDQPKDILTAVASHLIGPLVNRRNKLRFDPDGKKLCHTRSMTFGNERSSEMTLSATRGERQPATGTAKLSNGFRPMGRKDTLRVAGQWERAAHGDGVASRSGYPIFSLSQGASVFPTFAFLGAPAPPTKPMN